MGAFKSQNIKKYPHICQVYATDVLLATRREGVKAARHCGASRIFQSIPYGGSGESRFFQSIPYGGSHIFKFNPVIWNSITDGAARCIHNTASHLTDGAARCIKCFLESIRYGVTRRVFYIANLT